jgi:hypothetical protein
MKFSYGVMAKLKYSNTPNVASYLKNTEDMYDIIEDEFGPAVAISVSSWAELACVGEVYEHERFTIEMIESI